MPPVPEPQGINVVVPEDQIAGHYANIVSVWHTPHEFAIDFAVIQPFAGGPEGSMQAMVTARVRIPPTIVFDLLRTINENLAQYEQTFGEIKRPEPEEAEEADETDETDEADEEEGT
jgi:Protein of unknown function (DUF3467)